MAKIQRVGALEISQDLDFQRRTWVVEQVGWGVMALVVLAALLRLNTRITRALCGWIRSSMQCWSDRGGISLISKQNSKA